MNRFNSLIWALKKDLIDFDNIPLDKSNETLATGDVKELSDIRVFEYLENILLNFVINMNYHKLNSHTHTPKRIFLKNSN